MICCRRFGGDQMTYPTIQLEGVEFAILPLTHLIYVTGPTVYVFGLREQSGDAFALYVGETEEASGYLCSAHHRWDRACDLGMNWIAVCRIYDQEQRRQMKT